jgi:hypothetical protein
MSNRWSASAKIAGKLAVGVAAGVATIALSTSSAFALPPGGGGGDGGGGDGSGGGGTAAPKFTVVVDSLLCHVTEDNTGADEPYLLGNNVRFWGNGSLNNEQSATVDRSFDAQGNASIKLYDADLGAWPDYDDYLGTVSVTADQIGQGDITGKFTGDGASYEIVYHVDAR